jgi:hypothetical protein
LSPIVFSGIAFALILASAITGGFLRKLLPEHHLAGDSKDVIKLAIALIATMAALVLALLFASTRTSFERTSGYVNRMTADVVELDRLLAHYGPEAVPARAALRAEIGPLINSIWRDDAIARGVSPDDTRSPEESVLYMVQELVPKTNLHRSLRGHAIKVSADLAETQLNLLSQSSDPISLPFMIVLIAWLMFIFGIFSMSSEPNATLLTVLGVCALSASAAIFLILELALPFSGLMQVSNEALRTALK